MSQLEIFDLSLRLEGFSLQGISLDLERGAYLTVVGPTGSGKTLLLESLVGFRRKVQGSVRLGGRTISALAPEKRGIGIVYQDYALFPHFTVFQNIAYGLRRREKTAAVVRDRVEELAQKLGIHDLLSQYPPNLSGGERQRTAMARALVAQPELLLLDEPFSALDPHTRRAARGLLREVVRASAITTLHVSHDLDDTWALADKVALLEQGRLRDFGSVQEVFQRPRSAFLQRFVGTAVFEARVVDRRQGLTELDAGGVRLSSTDPARPGTQVRVVIRPEDVTLLRQRPYEMSARNVLECELLDICPVGELQLVRLDASGLGLAALVTVPGLAELGLGCRQRAYAVLNALHVTLAT